VGLNDNDDVVEGIVVMRKGENPKEVLERVKLKISELNDKILPKDIKMKTFYDRDNLMNYTTGTVMHNLFEGIILVTVIVFLFMADWRTTLIVSIIIPLSLLFAFLCLKLKGMSANLLSLGAVDFGIIIDGAVVMVEGLFVALDHRAHTMGMPAFNKIAKGSMIKKTGTQMGKAIFFSKLIIITALMPIFAFQKVEGKMFSPLAYTLGFALIGALLFTLTFVPVMSHILLNKNVKEVNNPFVNFWNKIVEKGFSWTFKHKVISLVASFIILAGTFFSATFLGTAFLPQLNEGALWVEAKLPMSNSLTETVKTTTTLRKELQSFPEVNGVLSQVGRSNDGTDPSGFYYVQMQVNLKPKEEWKRKISMDDAQAVLELAYGGKTATQKYEGEKKFNIRVRYQKEYRKDENDIINLKVPTISGAKIPLKEIAEVKKTTGPTFITKRFIRTRPIVMTALMASIGLLPAAISTGIGSESQKPLAIVIIGGLITATMLTLLVFPIIFWIFNRTKHEEIV
jgi:cobalt-zinc-cadmium resistance protein CzcA